REYHRGDGLPAARAEHAGASRAGRRPPRPDPPAGATGRVLATDIDLPDNTRRQGFIEARSAGEGRYPPRRRQPGPASPRLRFGLGQFCPPALIKTTAGPSTFPG